MGVRVPLGAPSENESREFSKTVDDEYGFHQIKLYSTSSSSFLTRSLLAGLEQGSTALINQFAGGALKRAIRNHSSEFLNANPSSLYYKYYKRIERLVSKDGVRELTDEMIDHISEFAVNQIEDFSTLVNDLIVTPDDEQKIKWEIEDGCRICAIIKETFTVDTTIMGEHLPAFNLEVPESRWRCFDYDELGKYGPPGRDARIGCGICRCEKRKAQ